MKNPLLVMLGMLIGAAVTWAGWSIGCKCNYDLVYEAGYCAGHVEAHKEIGEWCRNLIRQIDPDFYKRDRDSTGRYKWSRTTDTGRTQFLDSIRWIVYEVPYPWHPPLTWKGE